jgi:prevent-host-death family protein
MRTVSISVTEAARNFADCINRVRYQGATFVLHKNGMPVARIVPEGPAENPSEPAARSSRKPLEPKPAGPRDKVKPAPDAPALEIW